MTALFRTLQSYAVTVKTICRNWTGRRLDPETRILNRLIPDGGICLDIGAAFGRYTLVMSRLAGREGRVYAFEPADFSFDVLERIARFYRLENVVLIKQALSDREGALELAIPIKRSSPLTGGLGHSLAHLTTSADSNCERSLISVTALDRFAIERGIERLDFIKCDVEGAELSIFEGGREVLKRIRPSILCEVYETWLARYGRTRHEVFQFFSELNYRMFQLREKKLKEVNSIREDGNYFLIPSKSKIKL